MAKKSLKEIYRENYKKNYKQMQDGEPPGTFFTLLTGSVGIIVIALSIFVIIGLIVAFFYAC